MAVQGHDQRLAEAEQHALMIGEQLVAEEHAAKFRAAAKKAKKQRQKVRKQHQKEQELPPPQDGEQQPLACQPPLMELQSFDQPSGLHQCLDSQQIIRPAAAIRPSGSIKLKSLSKSQAAGKPPVSITPRREHGIHT